MRRPCLTAAACRCARYALIYIHEGCLPANRLFICDLQSLPNGIAGPLPVIRLIDTFDASYEYVANDATHFVFKTNLRASRHRLVHVDIAAAGAPSSWADLVPESQDVLSYAVCAGEDKLVLCYTHHVRHVLQLHSLADGRRLCDFPLDISTVSGCWGQRRQPEFFYKTVSFLTPGKIFRIDLAQEPWTTQLVYETPIKGTRERAVRRRGAAPPSYRRNERISGGALLTWPLRARCPWFTYPCSGAQTCATRRLRREQLQDRSSVLSQRRWYPRSNVHRVPSGPGAKRPESDAALRLRRFVLPSARPRATDSVCRRYSAGLLSHTRPILSCRHPFAQVSTSASCRTTVWRGCCSCSTAVAFWQCRISAVAASTARTGIRHARAHRRRTHATMY